MSARPIESEKPSVEPDRRPVRCPRCGYDQRGIMATWSDSCPLHGTCTECGLQFNWSEVFHPEKSEPLWCVEFAPLRRRVPVACVWTFVRSFWPWKYWSRLRMSHSIRWGRLAVYTSALFASMLLCYATFQGWVAVYVLHSQQQSLVLQQSQVSSKIASLQAQIVSPSSIPSELVAGKKPLLSALQQLQNTPPRIAMTYRTAIWEAVFDPCGSSSSGSIIYATGRAAYFPPRQLWRIALSSGITGSMTGPFWEPAARVGLIWLYIAAALTGLMPASLVLLPMSRRRAKVRWGHIGRVAVYSLFIPTSTVLLCGVMFGLGLYFERSADVFAECMLWMIRTFPALMLLCWWGAAISRYLRIPHGQFTAFMLMLLCALIIITAMWFINRKLLVHAF